MTNTRVWDMFNCFLPLVRGYTPPSSTALFILYCLYSTCVCGNTRKLIWQHSWDSSFKTALVTCAELYLWKKTQVAPFQHNAKMWYFACESYNATATVCGSSKNLRWLRLKNWLPNFILWGGSRYMPTTCCTLVVVRESSCDTGTHFVCLWQIEKVHSGGPILTIWAKMW